MCWPSWPSLMTMKTSCISRWSDGGQYVSTASMTKALAWLVSSAITVAIWVLLDPEWVSVTRVLRLGVIRCGCVCQQRHEVTGKYMHKQEIISCDVCLTFGTRQQTRRVGSWPGALQDVPSGLADAQWVQEPKVQQTGAKGRR